MNQKPQSPQKADEKAISRSRNKKRVIIFICVLTFLGIISFVILQNPEWLNPETLKDAAETTAAGKSGPKFYFYPTDFELDVTLDEVYMSLDREIYFKQGGETICLGDEDPSAFTGDILFFYQYFDTIIAGDAETYNTFFTERYYETNHPADPFAPQMIYDILIEKLSQIDEDDGDILYSYDVIYKIHKNDGSFRSDMDSDSSRRLCFDLIESGGVVKIDCISSYVYG